jgi:DNA (cytosine-5)-methyltransferase 1
MGTGGNNVPIVLENHPQDSRVTIAEDGNVPTLTSRMGTGGGNVPLILSQSHWRSEADAREEVREH